MKINKGFTLIELLVVVLIIGILAAIAVPQYQKAVGKSKASQAIIMLGSLLQAEESFYLAHGRYTADLLELDITIPDGTAAPSWASGNSAIPNDYVYSCYLNGNGAFVGCAANTANDNLPLFHRINGDYWCIGNGFQNKTQKASDICIALGGYKQKGERTASAAYYFMN